MPLKPYRSEGRHRFESSWGTLDHIRLRTRLRQLETEQDPVMAIVAGAIAAMLGALLMALLTVATGQQMGWLAVAIGLVVGYAVRLFGKGVTPLFGIIGATLALLGCLAGNLFSACIYAARREGQPVTDRLAALTPEKAIELMVHSFTFMDLIFYGVAIYVAYQYSFKRVTKEDLALPSQGKTA